MRWPCCSTPPWTAGRCGCAMSTPRARAARRAPVTTSGAVYSPHSRGSDALAVLQHAALDRRPVWLRYVNAQGQASHRIVEPTSVNGGYLTAYDHRREDTLTFALHRVTGVSELLGDEAP